MTQTIADAASTTLTTHPPFGRQYHAFNSWGHRLLLSLDRYSVIVIGDPHLFSILHAYERLASDDARTPYDLVDEHPGTEERRQELLEALEALAPYSQLSKAHDYPPAVVEDEDNLRPSIGMLTLFLAEQCNLRCRYCYTGIQVDKHPRQYMRMEVFAKAVDLLIRHLAPELTTLPITLFGGEPLLNKPLLHQAIEYVHAKAHELGRHPQLALTTNAVLLDEETARYLAEKGVRVMISLDGPEWAHDRHRIFPDGRGSHAQATANAKRWKELSGQLVVRATLLPGGPTVGELAAYFAELGVTEQVSICPAMSTGDNGGVGGGLADAEFVVHTNQQYTDHFMLGVELLKHRKVSPHDVVSMGLKRFNLRRPNEYLVRCGACLSSTAVGADGTLYPCHRFWPMREYAIGDVFEGFSTKKLAAFHRKYNGSVHQHCASCWVRYTCRGMCNRHMADERGDFVQPRPVECQAIKQSVEWSAGCFAHLAKNDPDSLRWACGSEAEAGAGKPCA